MDELRGWRVGFYGDPLRPPAVGQSVHRFDDPAGGWQAVYAAQSQITALCEALKHFRVDPATAQAQREAGAVSPSDGRVELQWRRDHVLIAVRAALQGPWLDLTKRIVRQQLEARLDPALLAAQPGAPGHLEPAQVNSPLYAVPQAIARLARQDGYAAVRYPARIDGQVAIAVFTDRGALEARPGHEPIALDRSSAALHRAARELGLTIQRVPRHQQREPQAPRHDLER